MGQEVNIDFTIAPQVERDLLEPILDSIVDSNKEMIVKKSEATFFIFLSSSLATMAKNSSQKINR